ncbi:MAG TPA: trehalose-6-phosphate synthase [Acidimicrobiales bacterium]|nr:trehalose-6-phosphate synthase [Acidimicrobiales bacterium]
MVDRAVVIVSNRGPVSFTKDDAGQLIARRGAGGLVSGIGGIVSETGATWMAAAISDGDREAARQGTIEAEGFRARLLAIDPETYRLAYDVISNQALWFVHHGLYDLPRTPVYGTEFRAAWSAYRRMNADFATAIINEAPSGAVVLVQDYHLALVAHDLVEHRRDLVTVHFSHTPFAPPVWLNVLPDHVAEELLAGMCAFQACGFHTQRWADDFTASCRDLLALEPRTFVSPLPANADDVRSTATSAACDAALADIDAVVGDRLVIGRVDRIELSKNIVRGFLAYDDLLERYPDWRGRVVFVASVYPSRGGVPDYARYQAEVDAVVERINDRWATDGWTPVVYDTSDDYPRSVALLRRYDVLLVNPLRDGLNLVAKEGAIVNERDGVLCLSPEAGVWSELGPAALRVRPYDVAGTADVLDEALRMSPVARKEHALALRGLAEQRVPADWLADQLAQVP